MKIKLSLSPQTKNGFKGLTAALLLVLLLGVKASSQTDYTIGANSGTTGGGYPCPFQDLYEGSRQQFLYRATDLAAAGMTTAGNITAIKFNVLDLYTTGVIENYTVKIKQVSLTALTLNGWEGGATTVYGPVNYQPTNGVNTLNFSSPFAWDGTSALLVEVCNGGASWTDNVNVAYTTVTGVQVSRIYRDDGLGSLCGYTGTAISGQTATTRVRRPIATFTVVVPQPCSGAPTIGAAQSSASTITCSGTAQLSLASFPQNLTGITYNWESSPAGLNTWTDISGGLTTPAYTTGTLTESTDFRVTATCGGSPTTSNVITVTVNTIEATPVTSSICDGNSQSLVASSPLPSNPILYSNNFDGGTLGDMVQVNNSTGGTSNLSAWQAVPDGYEDVSALTVFHSPTNTGFAISNSDDGGSGASINTLLTTPTINTGGYATLTLTFNHYIEQWLGGNVGQVQVSTDGGTNWTTLPDGTFSNVTGTSTSFASASCNLNAYINSNIQIRFKYTDADWNYWWAIDDISLSGTFLTSTYTWSSTDPGAGLPGTVNTQSISVTPTNGVGTYTYTVTSNNCGTSTATVDVVPAPIATITAGAPICDGQTADIMFTGNPGDVITFNTTESVTLDGAGEATYTTPVLTAGSYDYDVNTIANTTCTVNSTLSATQVVNPRPQGTLLGSTTVCKDVPAYISFGSSSVDFPIDVTLSDGVNTYNETATSSAENFIMPSDVPGVFTYEITALSDVNGCDAIAGDFSGTSTVTVNDRPSVIATSAAPGVCEGGNTDITFAFSGQAPYDFTYFDGTGSVVESEPTNTFMFNVLPTAATTYNVEYLADANGCIAQPADIASSATVIIYDTSKIVTQPVSVSACTENGVTITMTATGDLLNYTWYENGTAVPVDPNYTINDNEITINDVSGLGGNEYYVVVSGACGVDKISDTATLTEDFENSWTGTTSTAWSDMSNWSCGRVPIITTNVLVPGTAPFMPLVDITTALCNDVTLAASGASLGFDGTGNVLSVYGNIANNSGDFDGTDGTVVLAGTNQSITGATTYEDLEVMGGGTKVLDGDATVTGELILTDGFLSIGDNNLTIADMTMQTTGSAASYVVTDGTGEVVGQNMGSDSTLFHVGLVSSYNPVAIKNTGTPDTFMVRVMEHVYIDGDGTDPAVVDNPVVDRTWMISEQTDGGSFASVTPQWSVAEELGGFDQSHVYVAHFMGGLWTSPVDSTLFTPAAVAVGTMWSAMEDSIESFSPFAVASHGNFPLAIRLTSISAVNVGTRNKVEWKSVSEDAGDIYELERSVDGRTFTRIATVAAKGKPSTYTQWDANPVEGVNYYRAKLVSTDGKYNYSKVVSATMSKTGTFTIEAYPNPVHNTVSVKVNGVVTGKGSVVVTDVTGKVVSTATMVENNGAELNVSHLANGIYLLNYSDDVRNESIKINKQ